MKRGQINKIGASPYSKIYSPFRAFATLKGGTYY